MGQALYRKYRSRSLKDVVGQEHVTESLSRAIEKDRISHAYLFTGPRGVGKTSVARILAHQINGLPYMNDSSHIDIIEIDAASNRRIDEIRDLRDKVNIAPTSAKYKIYIIDEVHMLTREAFNALLKTLEEPPAHVIFILATTDAHKLPETIISRTQRFSFKPADNTKLVKLLKKIAESEKINIDDDAVDLIARHGGGSFRDSVSLLDQAANQADEIRLSNVQEMLGLPSKETIEQLLSKISAGGSPADVMMQLNKLIEQGFQATIIAEQLSNLIRQQFINDKLSTTHDEALNLLDQLLTVSTSSQPDRTLEIVLLRINTKDSSVSSITKSKVVIHKPVDVIAEEPKLTVKPKGQKSDFEIEDPVAVKQPLSVKETSISDANGVISKTKLENGQWDEVLKSLKMKHNTLYGVVRMAQPDFSEEGKIKLVFGFSFHQKRLIEPSNQQKLFDIIKQLTGQNYEIECILDKSAKPIKTEATVKKEPVSKPPIDPKPVPANTNNPDISNISNIFGNAELLES